MKARLSRSASRKAYPGMRWWTWLLVALFALAISPLVVFGDELRDYLADDLAIPFGLELMFVGAFLAFLAGLWFLRRHQIRQVKARVDFNQIVRMVQDDGGLHFATADIEFYLKWPGITQMLLEPDGVVVSHGNLFFIVPDRAFAAGDRLVFIRDVYDRLSESARKISEKHVRAALNDGGLRVAA